MSFSSVTVLNQQLDDLPADLREKVAHYMSEHLEDILDDLRWDQSFRRNSLKLGEFAAKMRREIEEGKSEEMDFSKL